MNEDEQVIEDIYQNQLESILYSLNQFSDDVVSNWRQQINLSRSSQLNGLRDLLTEYSSIKQIHIFSDSAGEINSTISLLDKPDRSLQNKTIETVIENKVFERLSNYKKEGFKKIEPVQFDGFENLSLLSFLSEDNKLYALTIQTAEFIGKILASKIQQAAGEQFVIACSKASSGDALYSSGEIDASQSKVSAKMWLFPNYEFSIQLKGTTIEKLVRDRAYNNIFLISVLTLFLVAAMFFVIKNIRKEIEIAKIKSDFVANVSHEIRTPLALISMYAETLELDRIQSEEKRKQYYSIISSETARLSRIVNSLLNFSKMEAGKRNYKFESVNINEIIRELINTYDFHLKDSGFEYRVNYAQEIPKIFADSEAISEAVLNLIDNAIKYSEKEKKIEINTGIKNRKIFIEVKDYGIGISENDQKKIFDKFFRASGTFVHNTKGTGLGLSLVKHIMDAHKGKIKLISKPGFGSNFILLFEENGQQE